jgi:DNA topoisomerase-1
VSKSHILIIAEKPKAALRIAQALGFKVSHVLFGVPYWIGAYQGRKALVVPAAGHLFTLKAEEGGYPVFEYSWAPRHEVERNSGYLKKFFMIFQRLSANAELYINACDFDIEGSVIGYMIIKAFGDEKKAKRVKFSSLTHEELRTAFNNLHDLDKEMIEAGLCRHELDWLWGINVSRALMDIYRTLTGKRYILSAGRVQSPTLMEVIKRQVDRDVFVPIVSFDVEVRVNIAGKVYKLTNKFPSPTSKTRAHEIAKKLRESRRLKLMKVEVSKRTIPPPPPFNLPDLQLEASRVAGISPSETLKIAESLYLNSLISYPRTNSQKLPKDLDNRTIVVSLSKINVYKNYCEKLLRKPKLVPRNGRKEDPAHPAIYPTGYTPRKKLSKKEWVIYDLIVRRYLSTFSDPAEILNLKYTLVAEEYAFALSGQKIESKGWLDIYRFVHIKEQEVPFLQEGQILDIAGIKVVKKYTKPPPRYTRATLLKWMESVNIGTEATRADILEVLFKRGYLKSVGNGIEVSTLGMEVAAILENYFSELISVELTRAFEEKMEAVRLGRKSRSDVVSEAVSILNPRLLRIKNLIKEHKRTGGKLLDQAVGRGVEGRSCVICGRLLHEVVDGIPLCKHHAKAYTSLRTAYSIWKERSGIDFNEYLNVIAKNRNTGKYVKEVVNYLNRAGRGLTNTYSSKA